MSLGALPSPRLCITSMNLSLIPIRTPDPSLMRIMAICNQILVTLTTVTLIFICTMQRVGRRQHPLPYNSSHLVPKRCTLHMGTTTCIHSDMRRAVAGSLPVAVIQHMPRAHLAMQDLPPGPDHQDEPSNLRLLLRE